MAESIVSDLTVRLLEFLGQSAAKKIAPYFGGRGKLDDLKLTMKMMQARLYDAERRQEAEDGALIKEWLRQLKRVMCRLEDLLEELTIADEQAEPRVSSRLTKMVCFLPSKLSSLKMNRTLLLEAEDIMRELERITSNMARFHFNELVVDQQRMNMINRREETISFIPEEEVIGRDEEKNEIRRMLLECDDVKKNLSVISIVGIGGLGKTTLAQLVFNDKQVEQHFELKSWACISDQIPNFRELVGKIFHSVCGKPWQDWSTEHLQSQLREAVDGKRFLLVLDDVWDDSRDWWPRLEHLLRGGKQGSKILATTRSRTIAVALSMGTIQPYSLNDLPEDKSWQLFKRIAFKDQLEEPNEEFISIGKEIIKKCGNVPLAIRTIAGHLCSRNTEYWMYFRDREIGIIGQTDIMPTLKISYHHLQPEQKQCFAYCALFEKDHRFDVAMLIRLWMAQGFVKSLDEGRVCFMELLRRCFFQNYREFKYEARCQMHDLMHDLAQTVGDECQLVDSPSEYVNKNTRHVRIVNNSQAVLRSALLSNTPSHLRSYVEFGDYVPWDRDLPKSDFDGNISALRRLRVLFLSERCYEGLPESVGELIHLRYLKVRVYAHYLPEGITKLRYLQSLDLHGSPNLRELPREFYRLTSLKLLRFVASQWDDDTSLIDMPPRFGELTSLQSLDRFVVGENNGLDALSGMNLAEWLVIYFKKQRENGVSEAAKANLKGKKLTALRLNFIYDSVTEGDELLEYLQPPSTLRHLTVDQWNGERFPQWGIHQLPSGIGGLTALQQLYILSCDNLRTLPESIGSLSQLRTLVIRDCSKLEALPKSIQNLTALERLEIRYCPVLKTRCEEPDGDDWPLIQHIPDKYIG